MEILYLIAAVVLSGIGCVALWLRNRKPRSTEAAIDSFQRGLRALAPDEPQAKDHQRPNPG